MSSSTPPELVKWYTRARRFPQLIGRTPDGAKIWGGPYTFTQAIGAGVIALVAVNTMGLWANYGFIGNTLVLAAVTYGGVLLLGRIPVGARSPISLIAGSMHAVMAPRSGRLGGRAVRPRRPHVVRHRVIVALGAPTPRPATLPRQRAAPSVRRTRPASKPVTAKHAAPKPMTAKTVPARPIPAKRIPAKRIAVKPPAAKTPIAKQPAAVEPPADPRPNLTGVQTLLAQGRTAPSERD